MENIFQNQNADAYKLALNRLERVIQKIHEGGGLAKLEAQRKEGKMTARERVEYLMDKDKQWFEIGELAGYEMYENYGGCPAGGVIVVLGYISGVLSIVVANDPSVKAGAWFPITGKKNLRAQEIAMENEIPIIYLVDSAGVFLPLQDEIFPDKENFGRIFRNNAIMSSKGIPQIAAIMGSCVAGGAYLPIMSDEALIVERTGSIFLAGPYLVKAAIGEDADQETLGGASTHCEISGVTDYKMKDDTECLDTIKALVKNINRSPQTQFNQRASCPPSRDAEDILKIIPSDGLKPYEMKEILECIADKDSLVYYKNHYGKTIICAYGSIGGFSVGFVANDRRIVKSAKGELQMGGVIYSDSADKATRFILNCNQKKIPLVFLHDVTGFMVGTRSEHGGIIKDGAKMVNAVANSTVPKFSVIIGNSYGAGNYAMCGKAYDPRLILAWPCAKIAVMGGAQAAKVLTQIQVSTLKAKGHPPNEQEEKDLFQTISDRYQKQTSPYYAAARLWVDAIIDPRETRNWLIMGIEASQYAPIARFNPGVIQT